MGNLRSVEKALARVGADVRIVSDRASVLAAERLVVPGVRRLWRLHGEFRKSGIGRRDQGVH